MRQRLAALAVLVAGALIAYSALSDGNDSPSTAQAPSPTASAAPGRTPSTPAPTPTPEAPSGLKRDTTLIDVETGATYRLSTETAIVASIAFSPDSRWLAYRRERIADLNDGNVYRLDLQHPDLPIELLSEGYLPIFQEAYSARGALAIGRSADPPVVLTADGVFHTLANLGHFTTWSTDGRWLTYEAPYTDEDTLMTQYIVDTETWQERPIGASLPCGCDSNPRPIWAPDSAHLIYAYIAKRGPDGRLGTEIQEPGGGSSVPIDVYTVFGWQDSTHYIRLVQHDNAPSTIASADIASGTLEQLYGGESPGFTLFSPDWQYLASQTSTGVRIVDRGGAVVTDAIRGELGEWSSDGSLILTYADNTECDTAALVYTRDGELLACAPTSRNLRSPAVISPDSRYVATIQILDTAYVYPPTDTGVYITDLATGERRLLAEHLYGDIACIQWSPDSRFLVVGHLCGI